MPSFKALLEKTNREHFQNVTKTKIEYDLTIRRCGLVGQSANQQGAAKLIIRIGAACRWCKPDDLARRVKALVDAYEMCLKRQTVSKVKIMFLYHLKKCFLENAKTLLYDAIVSQNKCKSREKHFIFYGCQTIYQFVGGPCILI